MRASRGLPLRDFKVRAKQFTELAHFPDGHVDDEVDVVGRARFAIDRTGQTPRQIASRLSGPAWRKSSKYLAFALGEVSLTKVNLPRAMLLAWRASRR